VRRSERAHANYALAPPASSPYPLTDHCQFDILQFGRLASDRMHFDQLKQQAADEEAEHALNTALE
jgi:hypothetical protein